MRLGKYIAHAGVASRRAAEELIFEGRVTVGGKIETNPARDVDDGSEVTVDGRAIVAETLVVYAVNKPLGVISTASDPEGRRTVVELVGSERRLYPVGRLDANSSGLMLVTNDGELANKLSHPRYRVPKRYRVRVRRGNPLSQRELDQLMRGVELEDGKTSRAEVVKTQQREFEIVIHEGRNHQVRRMCEAIGRDVGELTRIEFGGLPLGRLKSGSARKLGPVEIESLLAHVEEPTKRPRRPKPAPIGTKKTQRPTDKRSSSSRGAPKGRS